MKKFFPALVALAAACSPGINTPSDEQVAAVTKSKATVGTIQDLFGFADNGIRPGETLTIGTPINDQATAIRDRLATQTGGCSNTSLTLDGPVITATFPSDGCTMGEVNAKGGVSFEVLGVNPASVRVTGSNLVVNDESINGTVTFTTSEPGKMNVNVDVVSRGIEQKGDIGVTTDSLTPPNLVFDGTVTTKEGEEQNQYTFEGVEWKVGDCYPSDGSVKVNDDVTVNFDDETKSSGKVKFQGEGFEGSTTLPEYANCGS